MKTIKQSIRTNLEKNIPGVNWCDICDVRVQLDNHVISREHESGKKHQQNLKHIKYVELEE